MMRHAAKIIFATLIVAVLFFSTAMCAEEKVVAKAIQYHPTDLRFGAKGVEGNPFLVDFSGEFVGPEGKTLKAPGFYDGGTTWVIRFAPSVPGVWTYRTASSSPLLNGKTGKITAAANTSPVVHGRLRIDRQHPHHFIFEDGTRYFLLGFECDWIWALDTRDPNIPNLRRFVDVLVERGFNQIVTNVFAYDCSWSSGTTNQWDYGPPPIYPWEGTNQQPNFARMNLAFWQHYDRVVDYMFRKGMMAHIMLRVYNKMVKWPPNGSPEDDLYYRYAVARYGAYPHVIWDFSKEAHNEKDINYKLGIIAKIRKWDSYGNLITVHDDDRTYTSGTYDILDFRSDQQHSKWGEKIIAQREQRRWPILNIEYGYERGVEDLPTYNVMQDWQEVLRRTYEIYCAGGYCAYYYSNAAWDLIKWDPEPPGWKRYRILRDFFEPTRWWGADPHPELVLKGVAWCLADPGREYIVFAPEGGELLIRLAEGKQYTITCLNPYTGEKMSLGKVEGGDCPINLQAGHPWVLLIAPK
ncbi:DUF4038 domain-containing protein [Candidatus Sumerlaeota bacterium]|nr:DUF4038 domain-containing protein [Candidatus Sumerlaeota bacterium]